MRDRVVGSFKVKLVIYFLLLSLLPIGAAFWGFTQVAGQSETRRVDARLQSGMRAVVASYQERLDTAQHEATTIAKTPIFQTALQKRDLLALVHMVRLLPNAREVSVSSVDGNLVGRPFIFAATRQATVVSRLGLVGYVTVSVPFDGTLVDALRSRSGLAAADSLVILRHNTIVASSPAVPGTLTAPVGQMKTVSVG